MDIEFERLQIEVQSLVNEVRQLRIENQILLRKIQEQNITVRSLREVVGE